ncbi:MAG: hypothetical protein CUN52_10940 [Phototrophicales bacterium]|nr:MAG: hypothetical protein CUN52_10940 [Phototrophicales bacterium]
MTTYLIIMTAFCLYSAGASWMLQVVCYPTYLLVGEKEFVPFHISFGRRLLVAVIPMSLTCLALIAFVFIGTAPIPAWVTWVMGGCGAVILLTTIFLEVPKHLRLDKEGKSDALIHGLVRDNLPRTMAWTLASILAVYSLSLVVA